MQSQPFEDVVFEAASALGTVDLSRGITADLTDLGKLVTIALMYVGRVGPLAFAMALVGMRQAPAQAEDLAV